jgi:hypothetical protein
MLARGAGADTPRIQGDGMAIASKCRTRPISVNALHLPDAVDSLAIGNPFSFGPTR